jgi:hypothetical protein
MTLRDRFWSAHCAHVTVAQHALRNGVINASNSPGGRWASADATISLPTRAGTERDRVRDETAEAEAEQIGLGDPQMVQQRDDVTGQRLDRHRAAGVGGVPAALQLHRDDLPARRERFEQRPRR